ncbi:hypothetical protein [Lactiplantibacillus plantarum]|uniref:hypothetical protein n=1 Tax=Lactiplantibacillus plantarum TaxID=1590 RepID=UPI0025579ECA|nr:hypothetical protein [Lactiplantibacillus plantarum]
MKEVRFWGLLLGLFVCLGAVIPLVSKADVLDTAPAGLNLEGLFERESLTVIRPQCRLF